MLRRPLSSDRPTFFDPIIAAIRTKPCPFRRGIGIMNRALDLDMMSDPIWLSVEQETDHD